MEWIEVNPLPTECQDCNEEECYNCDYAGARWILSEENQLLLQRKALVKSMDRLQSQIEKIDCRLSEIMSDKEITPTYMTQEIWEECLGACVEAGDTVQYDKLWNEYPEFADHLMKELDDLESQIDRRLTEDELHEKWNQLKEYMNGNGLT